MSNQGSKSNKNGENLECSVIRSLKKAGWDAEKNTKPLGLALTGKLIIPDIVAKLGNRVLYIECKSNSPQDGSIHEKWLYAVHKISIVANTQGGSAVMVLDDQSRKLGQFIDRVIRVEGKSKHVLVYTLEEFEEQCRMRGV